MTAARVRVLWPDHLGLPRGKYVPERLAEHGVRHCRGTWALGYDREMTPYTPGSGWEVGLPDMEATFDVSEIRPGWEDGTKVVVADLESDGMPVSVSPRAALRKAVADWEQLGLRAYAGIELEAYLLEPDGAGGFKPIDTPGAFVYGTGTAVDPDGVIDDIWRAADRAGLMLESVNSEYDNGQFELTLRYDEALRAADDAFLFKVLAREVAAQRGFLLTFLGRPFVDRGGSGLHLNLSWTDESGTNVVNGDESDDGLSDLARHCIGGMLEHHRALAGLCAPTVNAYKRLKPAQLSGYWANWGYDHRGATVRVSPERGTGARLEHRLSDGAAPVHVALAAVLQASRLGAAAKSDPGPPEGGNGLDVVEATVGTPANLGAALDELEADTALVEAIGSDLVAQHLAVKRTEWQKFSEAVTDWELREYLPFL
ncbi:MAG TPA: glutamine synthetase family protein [Acidimicrobiales bacterium]|nr:glutamine synthetase family protein [Acidimicrobiales bacterium]